MDEGNAENLSLDMLRDIHVPDPISYAPQTVGWWVVFAVLALVALVLGLRARRRWKRNAYRRMALARLDAIEAQGSFGELPRLIKRTALDAWPRGEVAPLSGAPWLAFLDRSYGGDGFSNGPGRALPALAYGSGATADPSALITLIRIWIRKHRA